MLALLVAPALAATHHVGAGQPFRTIQDAVNAASDGDAVMVHGGTYTEFVDTSKVLAFFGLNGATWRTPNQANAAALTMRAGGDVTGFVFEGGGHDCVEFRSTVPNEYGSVVDAEFRGCEIAIVAYDTVAAVANVRVTDSTRVGINHFHGELTVEQSVFLRNNSSISSDNLTWLSDNLFVNNDGGVGMSVQSTSLVEQNVFCGNGGGLGVDFWTAYGGFGPTYIRDNTFVDNVNTNGYGSVGGLSLRDISQTCAPIDVRVHNNSFAGNKGDWAAHLNVGVSGTDLRNNAFARAQQWAGSAAVAANTYPAYCYATVTGDYNLFYDNDVRDLSGIAQGDLGAHTLWGVDPMITAYSRDGRCGNDDLSPLVGSPIVDGGDPASPADPDGSRADIGSRYRW